MRKVSIHNDRKHSARLIILKRHKLNGVLQTLHTQVVNRNCKFCEPAAAKYSGRRSGVNLHQVVSAKVKRFESSAQQSYICGRTRQPEVEHVPRGESCQLL